MSGKTVEDLGSRAAPGNTEGGQMIADAPRLPCDVKIDSIVFRRGVKLQTLIDAATRWRKDAARAFAFRYPTDYELDLACAAYDCALAERGIVPNVNIGAQKDAMLSAIAELARDRSFEPSPTAEGRRENPENTTLSEVS